jgi:hypothetical protein
MCLNARKILLPGLVINSQPVLPYHCCCSITLLGGPVALLEREIQQWNFMIMSLQQLYDVCGIWQVIKQFHLLGQELAILQHFYTLNDKVPNLPAYKCLELAKMPTQYRQGSTVHSVHLAHGVVYKLEMYCHFKMVLRVAYLFTGRVMVKLSPNAQKIELLDGTDGNCDSRLIHACALGLVICHAEAMQQDASVLVHPR